MRLTASLIPLLLAGPALAAGDPIAAGKSLVEVNCTRCHNVTEAGESPLTDAPPFREAAKNYTQDELVDGFMEGLAVRHPMMPDWDMTLDQAEAIAAYVMSLKPAGAEKEPDTPIGVGHQLLASNCARCHAIESEGESPMAKAPAFREIVKRYDPENLEEALAEGIVTGHAGMPELSFAPENIAAIVAYLEALKAGDAP
jgi:mono/diheme cytochrome c family protein